MTREARTNGYCTACGHMVRPGDTITTAPGVAKLPGLGWVSTYLIVACEHCHGDVYRFSHTKHDQRRVAVAG
mgnify:FL=1